MNIEVKKIISAFTTWILASSCLAAFTAVDSIRHEITSEIIKEPINSLIGIHHFH